jgi:3-hydroxyisobutyrate dehydrogenase-like beta-hydroxyacid dehydrogenase
MIDLAIQDLDLALNMAEVLKTPAAVGNAARGLYKATRDRGARDRDWTTLCSTARALAGLD